VEKKPTVIFRRFRKLPDGRVLDAWLYGFRAWPIPVTEEVEENKTTSQIEK
jgi:hypothetical protein